MILSLSHSHSHSRGTKPALCDVLNKMEKFVHIHFITSAKNACCIRHVIRIPCSLAASNWSHLNRCSLAAMQSTISRILCTSVWNRTLSMVNWLLRVAIFWWKAHIQRYHLRYHWISNKDVASCTYIFIFLCCVFFFRWFYIALFYIRYIQFEIFAMVFLRFEFAITCGVYFFARAFIQLWTISALVTCAVRVLADWMQPFAWRLHSTIYMWILYD